MVQESEMLDRESEAASHTSLAHQQAVERVIRAMRDRPSERNVESFTCF